MGRFDALSQIEEQNEKPSSLPASHQTSKPVNQQKDKPANPQTSKPSNHFPSKMVIQQTSKPVNQHTFTIPLSTKEKTKYTTYLKDESILKIKVHAAQAKKKDHEILQEIVDLYFNESK